MDKQTGEVIADAKFMLQKHDGGGDYHQYLEGATNSAGEAVFRELQDGLYRFIELTAGEDYDRDSVQYYPSAYFTVLGKNDGVDITATNKKLDTQPTEEPMPEPMPGQQWQTVVRG